MRVPATILRFEGRLAGVAGRLGEAPWVVASIVAVGANFVERPNAVPFGADWHQYLTAVLYLAQPGGGWSWPDWREPLHAWLVLGLGPALGYVIAAKVVSRVGVALIVAGAALVARGLGGRGAALVAVVLAARADLLVPQLDAVTPYPLLGGLAAMAFGLGAVGVRTGSVAAAVGAAWFGSAAWMTDVKGVPAAMAAAVLVGLTALRAPWRRTLLLLPLAALAAWAPVRLDQEIKQRYHVTVLPTERQIALQREILATQIRLGDTRDPAVTAACTPLPARFDPRDACARALFQFNARNLQRARAFPSALVQGLAALCLVPALSGFGRTRLRSALMSGAGTAVTVGASVGSVVLGMGWIWYWDRYALASVGALLALLPIAAARVGALVRPAPFLATGVLLVALLAWDFAAPRPPSVPPAPTPEAILPWLGAQLEPDDVVYDCAGLAVDVALAPRPVRYARLLREHGQCAMVPAGDQRGWYLRPVGSRAPTEAQLQVGGWFRVASPEGPIEVWHTAAVDPPAP